MIRVGLIDAGGANLGSVRYALERLGVNPVEVCAPEQLDSVERLILPGVGAAGEGMRRLHGQGLFAPLRAWTRPLLGICLGMQLLFEELDEGDVEGLGLLSGRVARMPRTPDIRLPHMGWNRLLRTRVSPLLDGIAHGARMYFVHGYAAPVTPTTIATCTHGEPFAAAVQSGSIAGAQFHPERSAAAGEQLLRNFLAWTP